MSGRDEIQLTERRPKRDNILPLKQSLEVAPAECCEENLERIRIRINRFPFPACVRKSGVYQDSWISECYCFNKSGIAGWDPDAENPILSPSRFQLFKKRLCPAVSIRQTMLSLPCLCYGGSLEWWSAGNADSIADGKRLARAVGRRKAK